MAKKKAKLPKKIAGYKVPKAFRKNSVPILALLRTRQAQALVGAAIAAALAAMAEREALSDDDSKAKGKGSKAKDAKARDAKEGVQSLAEHGMSRATEMAEALGRAIAAAIHDHLPAEKKVDGTPTRH